MVILYVTTKDNKYCFPNITGLRFIPSDKNITISYEGGKCEFDPDCMCEVTNNGLKLHTHHTVHSVPDKKYIYVPPIQPVDVIHFNGTSAKINGCNYKDIEFMRYLQDGH